MTPRQTLHRLLLDLFTREELRVFIRHLPYGDEIQPHLSSASATDSEYVDSFIAVLERRKLLDGALFGQIQAVRPRCKDDINRVAMLWLSPRTGTKTANPSPGAASNPKRPNSASKPQSGNGSDIWAWVAGGAALIGVTALVANSAEAAEKKNVRRILLELADTKKLQNILREVDVHPPRGKAAVVEAVLENVQFNEALLDGAFTVPELRAICQEFNLTSATRKRELIAVLMSKFG